MAVGEPSDELVADVASFYNLPLDEARDALLSGTLDEAYVARARGDVARTAER